MKDDMRVRAWALGTSLLVCTCLMCCHERQARERPDWREALLQAHEEAFVESTWGNILDYPEEYYGDPTLQCHYLVKIASEHVQDRFYQLIGGRDSAVLPEGDEMAVVRVLHSRYERLAGVSDEIIESYRVSGSVPAHLAKRRDELLEEIGMITDLLQEGLPAAAILAEASG